MKVKYLLLLSFFGLSSVFAQIPSMQESKTYQEYISLYKEIAIQQQKEYGIPASITLAQGLIESAAGQGELAVASNNHFGIKCGSVWDGEKVYHDDDTLSECFRKYDKVLDSYVDHSNFLKNKSRYAFLFELSSSDYQGWAYGLKKAGYATDPEYPVKLISIIERYNLHAYDLNLANTTGVVRNPVPSNQKSVDEKKKNIGEESIGSVSDVFTHAVKVQNGVKYVVSLKGDSYSSIAMEFELSEKSLIKYNDVATFQVLQPGMRVYLQQKKNKVSRGSIKHVVKEGESMYSICQNYAIQLSSLYELNKMPVEKGVVLGQVLKLK